MLRPHALDLPTTTAAVLVHQHSLHVHTAVSCCVICSGGNIPLQLWYKSAGKHQIGELPFAADWDDTLLDLWQDLQNKTAQLTCKEVQDNSEVATAPSCTITVRHTITYSPCHDCFVSIPRTSECPLVSTVLAPSSCEAGCKHLMPALCFFGLHEHSLQDSMQVLLAVLASTKHITMCCSSCV